MFRLLSGCILATDTRPRLRRGLSPNDRRTLIWLRKAGIRLTAAELCYLNDQGIAPEARYLGKENRQTLVERILGDKSDRIAPKSVNRTLYLRYIRHVKPSDRVCKQVLKGKRVAIPEKFAERHYRHTMKLIGLICDHGGRYYISPTDCNLFVNYPVYHDDGTLKTNPEIARLQQKRGVFRVKIHTPDSFFALLGMTAEEFEAMPMPEVDYLLDEKYAPRVNAAGEKSERQKPIKKNRTVL